MIQVNVKHGDVGKALKILKKKMLEAGIIRELRERSYYKKPSQKRKEKKARAIRRIRLDNVEENTDVRN